MIIKYIVIENAMLRLKPRDLVLICQSHNSASEGDGDGNETIYKLKKTPNKIVVKGLTKFKVNH